MYMKKKITALLLATSLCLTMGVTSMAAGTNESISVKLDCDVTVAYNGTAQRFADNNGATVYPMNYGGTTYLPVRAVSGLLGLDISFDGTTNTVALKNGGTVTAAKAPVKGNSQTVTALMNRQMSITYNGATQSFTDVNGKAVYPISYNGTTYLPVRAVSGLLNLPVSFDGKTNTVILGTAPVTPPTSGVSSKLFDNQVSINGTVVTFPAKMADLAALGFVLPASKKDYTINPNAFTSGRIETAGGDKLFGGFYNLGATTIPLSTGMITDVNFAKRSITNAKIVFAGGLTFGASQADVIAAYGAPAKKQDGGTTSTTARETYKYTKDGSTGVTKDYVEILFENGKLTQMEIYTNEV